MGYVPTVRRQQSRYSDRLHALTKQEILPVSGNLSGRQKVSLYHFAPFLWHLTSRITGARTRTHTRYDAHARVRVDAAVRLRAQARAERQMTLPSLWREH